MSGSPGKPVTRAAYMLDGRRVTVADLVDAGLLATGAALRFRRPRVGNTYHAVVTDAYMLRLDDGQEFRSPSRAAAVAADVPVVDGWHAWVVGSSRRSLDSLRQELLDRVPAGPEADDAGDEQPAPPRPHEFLKNARRRADAGDPVEASVRDLLALWGARGRGHRVSQRVEADLGNRGLVTLPSFRAVTLDTAVRLVAAPMEAERPGEVPPDEDGPEGPDGGLTVGNLPSALNGVVSVPPTGTFDEAITLMLLNDYSQLAVLAGPRTLRGAVTWKSIAKARHASGSATFADAVIPPHEVHDVRYDRELIDVLPLLEESDFVFVRDETSAVAGIVTTADVVHAYGELATPFFLIGELDQALRQVISRNFTLDEVTSLCDSQGTRTISSFDHLSMGDYQRVLESPGCWEKLGWRLHRVAFVRRLQELRDIRNDVVHFNPDPVPEDAVDKLRSMIGVLRQYAG